MITLRKLNANGARHDYPMHVSMRMLALLSS